jgi:FkbM family methyltransferase
VRQSLKFDAAILRIDDLPRCWRFRFLFEKYIALWRLARGKQSDISVGPRTFHVHSMSSLGTLQSNIVDFHREVVDTGLLCGAQPTILDIGANVGQFCFAAKLFYPSARVLSFEADPDTFALLRRNAGDLPDVTLHNVALASRDDERTFYRHTFSTMSSFLPYPDCSYAGADKQITLSTRRLDDVISRETAFDLVKIDVEGYELEVIEGGVEVLRMAHLLLAELRLCSSPEDEPNLELFATLFRMLPEARLVRCGRPLGPSRAPVSQDMLFDLSSRDR